MTQQPEKPWTTARGTDCAYLLRNGFYAAKSCGVISQGLDDMQKLADQLNELEALRESHAELLRVLLRHNRARISISANYQNSPLGEDTEKALSVAKYLTKPNKTPTTAS